MNYVRTFSSSNLQQPKELRGAAFPGVPGIVLGRNEYIAWGITLGYTDVQDIYMLKADSSKEDYYVVDGVSLPFKTFTETIKSSDSAPVTIKIRESIFGTVVGSSETEFPAYRWVAQQDNDKSFNYLIHLMFSKNWDEFKTNVNGMTSIVFNFAYLDVYGNIGYKLSGLIPIRREGHTGRYIVRGDTKAWDYSGYLPTNQNPELFNPAKGYVSSANNRVVPPGYPILVSANYFFYYRQERIQELMDELMKNAKTNGAKITLQNMVDIQLDTYSILYREYRFMFVNMTSDVAKFASTSSYASTRKYSQHLQTLLVWDGYVKRTSTEASLFEGFLRYLSTLVSKEFGDNSETKKMALFYFYKDAMLRNNDIACLSKNFKSCTEYGAATFIHVVDLFYQQYGKIPEWGDIHTTPIYHISGKDTPILGCLSKISLSTDGGTETILLNNMNENYETIEAPVFREIISFNSVNEDRFIIPTGNDGNLFSKTYENMGTLYAKGQYLSFASNMSQVNAVDTYLIYVK
nr:unnamed protein product [Naegleria fowleri]